MKSNIYLLSLSLQKDWVIGQVCTIQSLVTIMLFLKKIFAHTPGEILLILQAEEVQLQNKIQQARDKKNDIALAQLTKQLQKEMQQREKIKNFLDTKRLSSRNDTPEEAQKKEIQTLKTELQEFYAAQRRDRLLSCFAIICIVGLVFVAQRPQQQPLQQPLQQQTQTK
ncbi:MAG: hypothetical protein ACK5UY_05780 [Holosporales bacterium]